MAMSKILVIDDEPWLREMVRLALEQQGYEVVEAKDGNEGAAQARKLLPDLILCDVKMSNQADAGYTTLAKLREDAATAAIPFILMTGFADSAGMRHGMELGADDYLPKPFKVDELYATVNTRLRKVQTVREHAERKLTTLRTQISLMMPHELRTPLNGIIANAEMLASDPASLGYATIAEMGQEICKSGQRLERLIENFLFYARLEIVATDADSVIALRAARILEPGALVRTAAIMQAEIAGRQADLTLELVDTPLPMAEEYFKKIVAELVQNAFKFSETGSPVRVSLQPVGDEIEFSVHDCGRGLSTEHIRRIDAYVQFERKMQDEQGLGLGLAIAKKLAELHGGRLAISSHQETGTTVIVKLPKVRKP
jgi:two-component system sensor histidine kinase/response regulator